jgi:hypothetical protein
MCHQHQKLWVIRQVFDERFAAWSTVESIVSKDFLRIATSDIQQAIVAKCHSSATIKAGGLWLDKRARGSCSRSCRKSDQSTEISRCTNRSTVLKTHVRSVFPTIRSQPRYLCRSISGIYGLSPWSILPNKATKYIRFYLA